MAFDLVIRNGTIIDGSGLPGYRGDIAVDGERIVKVGRVNEKGRVDFDAEGHVITPGFIDGHAHMDAQVFWDHLGSSSCWHGVTSVIMGNCGFTLAPSLPEQHHLVMRSLEKAEDISPKAMTEGIDWTWESFPEYLEAVDRVPKAINYGSQIGHSALRTFAMGERAFSENATSDELKLMRHTLREAMRAGAVGFTTSRATSHITSDGHPVASRLAPWNEIVQLVGVLQEEGAGIFEIANMNSWERIDDPNEQASAFAEEFGALKDLAVATRVPTTYGMKPQRTEDQLAVLDAAGAEGGNIFCQTRSGSVSIIFCFRSHMPYDRLQEWQEFRARSLDDQLHLLREGPTRDRLAQAVRNAMTGGVDVQLTKGMSRVEKLPPFDEIQIVRDGQPNESVASLAAKRGVDPIDLILDLAVETNLEQIFGRFYDSRYPNLGWTDEDIVKQMKHPRTVMTFSDTGAHVGHHSGAELQTTLLSKWVREREQFTLEEAVKMITLVPATHWGLNDRGLLREGMIADINVFDPVTVGVRAPTIEFDLPGGEMRVLQRARGYLATFVAGRKTFDDGKHTGEYPGKLLRGPLASH